ncbi:ABC transporter permease [Pseudonocardia sp. MH-G8]|uniref:ABC transporter permease n=1 Tax=Pseudonocardia sp. MH-G8 TaxID=1854588 RepID=UPI000B9FA47F|nr:ABC transporter permease [Pseudonocardia sp. MH-G8]OZM76570.1 hypothetical protein CFP66_40440 [Pseudonocardia sp. MH-G8]
MLLVAGLLFPGLAPGATEIAQPVLVAATVPAQPPDTTPTPEPAPVPVPDGCEDGLPIPVCAPATPDAPGDGFPLTLPDAPPPGDSEPCEGFGCLPDVPAPGVDPGAVGGSAPGVEPAREPCGFTDLGGCVSNAINDFFRGLVTAALNPLLDLLSNTLLTTPELDTLPGLAELWSNSWQILLACYSLLVLVAAIVIMSFESLQTRYTAKEIAPRIVVGFLAGALSLWAATRAVEVANGLSRAVMFDGLDPADAGQALREITLESLDEGIFILFVGVFLVGMLLALLVGFVIRVALTVILVAGAPIALMFHALPQTEHIAYWWWRALGGCLAIQVVQSLTLITAMRVFLTPGGFTLFGPTGGGLVNLLVACALMYVLYKIPFWVLGSIRGGGGQRSLIGSLVRGFIAYKTFGLLSGRGSKGGGRAAASRGGRGRGGRTGGGGTGDASGDAYGGVRADSDGQYMLPLTGLRRVRPARRSGGDTPPAQDASPRGRGRQLALPLGEDWPENRPVLGHDGQYRLPIDAPRRARTKSTPPGTPKQSSATPAPAPRRRRSGVQLELPLDPYQGNRARRDGQYPLPLDGVHRVRRTPTPTPPAPPRPTTTGPRPRQLELPFDPYRDNRPDQSGQYPLPLDDLRRVPRRPATAVAPTPVVRPAPAPAPPAAPRSGGQQLRLPIGLPTPTRPPATPPPPAPAPRPPARRRAAGTGATPAARPAAAAPARDEPGSPPASATPPARRTPRAPRRPRRSRPADPTGGTT